MEFNIKLQEMRKAKGLTQEELAEALYVSRTAISKWESGRGYPNLDSLKALAKFFSVSVDELLSGDEVLTIAEENRKQSRMHLCDLIYGLLDISTAIFFFLPLFAQRSNGIIQEVSLLSLTEISTWLKIMYFASVTAMTVFGVLTLAMQNCQQVFWVQNKGKISLALNALLALLFIISLQPYGAVVLCIFLAIKAILLIKKI